MNDLSHSHKNKKIKSHLSKNSLFYVLLSEYLYVTIVLFFLKKKICLCENFNSHEFV